METEEPRVRHRFRAERAESGVRLDVALARRFPGYSRSKLQRFARGGHAFVNGKETRPGRVLAEGDEVEIALEQETREYAMPEKMALSILHDDPRFVVLDKPAGLTVHPGAGERRGTLANALAYHFGELSSLQGPMRPGIVHRLDRETSGVMVVAKDDGAHQALAAQFKARTVSKTYLAVCHGVVDFDADLVNLPIGRDARRPERMAVRYDIGRASETYYEVRERFRRHSLVEVHPRTGRTHQIRVHMTALGHPLVADHVYGRPDRALRGLIARQALHAWRLEFHHPETAEELRFEAPVPADMVALLEALRSGAADAPESLAEEMGVADAPAAETAVPAAPAPPAEDEGD